MNYYQLLINPKSKKWDGFENPNQYLLNNNIKLSDLFLQKLNKKWDFESLEYTNLVEGKIPPIHSIGTSFIIFDSNIQNVQSIELPGIQLFPIINMKSLHQYFVMNVYQQVDCVDWERSEIDRWGENDKIEEWDNKRGRFFLNSVLIKNRIPDNIEVFRLQEWGGAFNIVVSDVLKERINKLDFDKSFLVFKILETV